jgi:hypothetical protein
MSNAISELARKALAIVVLIAAAWLLLHLVIGVIATLAWIVVAVLAVAAVIWAIRAL